MRQIPNPVASFPNVCCYASGASGTNISSKGLLMKKVFVFVSFATLIFILGAVARLLPESASAQVPAQAKLQGFTISEIRFDESTGEKRATPVVPKDWKFVTVSNGEKANSNNLWFQDAAGNIYMVQGFTSYGKFIVNGIVQKLAAQ
jgi:hypothetical protein